MNALFRAALTMHNEESSADFRYTQGIELDNVVRAALAGFEMYTHLGHLEHCDIDLNYLMRFG